MHSQAIADLTRAHRDTEAYLLSQILEHLGGPPDAIFVAATTDQFERLDEAPEVPRIEDSHRLIFPSHYDYNVVVSRVRALIVGKLKDSDVKIYSFHPAVLALPATISRDDIACYHIHKDIAANEESFHGTRTKWPSNLIEPSMAIDYLTRALARSQATSRSSALYQTDIRSHLVAENREIFDKSNPLAAAPGLISSLVNLAEDAGVVEVDKEGANPLIWLAGTGGSVDSESMLSVGEARDETPGERRDRTVLRGGKLRGSPVLRSQRIMDCLKKGAGPFSEVRHAIYDRIESRVAEGEKQTVRELLYDAARYVRERKEELIGKPSLRDRYPYRRIPGFLIDLMLLAPVFIGEDEEEMPPTLANMGRRVDRLASDWRMRLDGELIVFLVEEGMAISAHDLEDLTGALMADRDNVEKQEWVSAVITHLLSTGRIRQGGPPQYCLELPD